MPLVQAATHLPSFSHKFTKWWLPIGLEIHKELTNPSRCAESTADNCNFKYLKIHAHTSKSWLATMWCIGLPLRSSQGWWSASATLHSGMPCSCIHWFKSMLFSCSCFFFWATFCSSCWTTPVLRELRTPPPLPLRLLDATIGICNPCGWKLALEPRGMNVFPWLWLFPLLPLNNPPQCTAALL